jgi:hypothetical protein
MNWWQPGMPGGLLSRRWAQAHVFPLPELKKEELEASLRFKAQALLPADELSMKTRLFRHGGKLFGLVLVDRLPADRPTDDKLSLGTLLQLPKTWPKKVLLAVESPEGWEVHRFEERLLAASFPPLSPSSTGFDRLKLNHPDHQLVWYSPETGATGPEGFEPCPGLPASMVWGIPWANPVPPKWPALLWTTAILLLVVGWGGGAWFQWDSKTQRNEQWRQWVKQAQRQAAQALPASTDKAVPEDGGIPLEEIFQALAADWPYDVTIRKGEIQVKKLVITAQARSALEAVGALGKDSHFKSIRVLEVRPGAGGEEFDLEGEWNYDH